MPAAPAPGRRVPAAGFLPRRGGRPRVPPLRAVLRTSDTLDRLTPSNSPRCAGAIQGQSKSRSKRAFVSLLQDRGQHPAWRVIRYDRLA